ncbi:hypothetical protein V1525DRAFT_389455 [Lipomyces kononenkoae]|uniref:Uncharacterized protein n=1 Tax=Lipomyces kononenkoae TaxID=34357 RepID=A0ACC3SXV2_LIPKO
MTFFYDQIIKRLPYPTGDLGGKTVIVTGSNIGLLQGGRAATSPAWVPAR